MVDGDAQPIEFRISEKGICEIFEVGSGRLIALLSAEDLATIATAREELINLQVDKAFAGPYRHPADRVFH